MNKLQFNKSSILEIQLPEAGKRLTVYDTTTPKLALRITSSGSRTFYVVKRAGASIAWVKLGAFPEMTVEQAKVEALKILGAFANGANPAAARRAIRQEPIFTETLVDMLDNKKKRDGSPITERTKKDYLDTARLHMSSIANFKLSHIKRADVKAIHTKTSKKSERQADKAVAIISSVFNYALDHELVSVENPASRIQKNALVTRDRFAQSSELPYLLTAIGESSLSDFFLLSLLTGARRSNVQSMAWRDIDFDSRIWRLIKTKNGTPQNITLSAEAIAALQARKKNTGPSPFVFPSTSKAGHLVEPKKAWATTLLRASLRQLLDHLASIGALTEEERSLAEEHTTRTPVAAYKRYKALATELNIDTEAFDMTDLRIHDLRRTLGSWQAKTGASLVIIGKSLNHKSIQSTAIYARLDLDPVRQSVDTATQAMLEAAGINKKAEVLDIKSKKYPKNADTN